jgi:hypothetical protein
MVRFNELLDEVIEADRGIAMAMARRAEAVDRLRRHSEAMAATRPDDPSADRGWDAATCARRELQFELAAALTMSENAVRNLLSDSRFLVHELPSTMAALGEGAISFPHARVLIDHAVSVAEESRARFEEALLPFAKSLTLAKFRRVASRKRESMGPGAAVERHTEAIARRTVWVEHEDDGMATVGARLPAEEAVAIFDRLTTIANGYTGPAESRTLGQKRADAFADLLLTGDTCDATAEGTGGDRSNVGHGIRPRVLVTVPVMTLLGKEDTPAHLEGYGPIDAETARQLTSEAPSLTRILVHPVSSAILDFDRTRYAVPPELRTVLRVRDETCRAVGCDKPAAHGEVDHTVGWAEDGTTRLDNLAFLCTSHHHVKTFTRVRLRNLGNGDMEWTMPSGRVYVTVAANRLELGRSA